MINKIIIVDNNISSPSTSGHYIERAITLSDVFRRNGCNVSLLTPSDRMIQFDSLISSKFDNFIFEPGFNTFHQKSMSSISVYDRTILNTFKEVAYNLNLPLYMKFSDDNFVRFNKFHQDFINNFIESIDSYYCAAPNETICYAITLLKIAGFHIHGETPAVNLEVLNNIWLRVRREENSFVNIASQRILEKYSESNVHIVFSTANTYDLKSGISYLLNNVNPGRLTYVLHQPREFNSDNSYSIKMLISRLDTEKRKLLNFTVASNEFKHMLTSKDFNHIGSHVGVTIGPFVSFDEKLVNGEKFDFYPHVLASYQLKRNKVPAWLIKSDALKNSMALKYRINFEKTNSIKIFTKKVDSIINQNSFIISFLGDIRDEKMFNYYSIIITSLWNVGIKVFAIHPTFFSNGLVSESEGALADLLEHPYHLKYGCSYENSLPRGIFHKLLQCSSIVYNCYDPVEYACKQSGIFYETLLNGRRSLVNPATSAASAWSSFTSEYCSIYFREKINLSLRLIDSSMKSVLIPAKMNNINYLEIDFDTNSRSTVASFSYVVRAAKTSAVIGHGTVTCQAGRIGGAVFSGLNDGDAILELIPNLPNFDIAWNAEFTVYSNTGKIGSEVLDFFKFVIAPNCDFMDNTNELTKFVVNELSTVNLINLENNTLLRKLRKDFSDYSQKYSLGWGG